MQTLARRIRSGPRGVIDLVEIVGDTARIRGWALTAAGEGAAGFAVSLDGRPAAVLRTDRIDRPDVAGLIRGAATDCGFVLTVAWPGPPAAADRPAALAVTATDGAGRPFEIAAGPATTWRRAAAPAPRQAARQRPHPGPASVPGPGAAPAVPDAPILTPKVAAALGGAMAAARCYLEYGSGGSTLLAVDTGIPAVISVESDARWLEAVRAKLGARLDPGRHHLLHGDIGPTGRFGHPVSEARWRSYPGYALDPWDLCRDRGLAPDLVLVDGRFRVACLIATLLHAKPGTRVLFDDYYDRAAYHGAVAALAPPPRRIGRMADFAVPERRDPDRLWRGFVAALGQAL